MLNIAFYRQEQIEDELFEHVVIMAKMNGEWIFCRHKERDTWEFQKENYMRRQGLWSLTSILSAPIV